jgi:hypothetical protein
VTDTAPEFEFSFDYLEFFNESIINEFNTFISLSELKIVPISNNYKYAFNNRIKKGAINDYVGTFKYASTSEQVKLHIGSNAHG